ncbi:unnamed protein product [Camellia sinensis]
MAFGNGNPMDIDEDLHSRQLAAYGRETMRRLFASNALVFGMQGLGVEIEKHSTYYKIKGQPGDLSQGIDLLFSYHWKLLDGRESMIIPQSVCSRYGLAIGAAVAPFVCVLVWICFPVAYPISKLLDFLLGHVHVALFRRAELKTLVDLHGNEAGKGGEFTHNETTILSWFSCLSLVVSLHVDSVVYLVDAYDKERFVEAKKELDALLSNDSLANVPFLILGNKIDIPYATSEDELRYYLGLTGVTTGKGNVDLADSNVHPIEVFMCSIMHKMGYGDGFKWLSQYIK